MKLTVCCLLISLFFSGMNVFAEPVFFNVGYENAEQPPYYMGQDEVLADKPGVAVEMVQLLEQEIPGLQVRLGRYPWIRCTQYLADGQLDGIFNASFKAGRLETGRYPWKNGTVNEEQRITTMSYGLYVLENSPVTWDGEVIRNLGDGTVGAPRGYSIVGDLMEKGVDIEEVSTSRQILMMLQSGRIAAGAMQQLTADTILKNEPQLAVGVRRISPPLAEKPYYLLISHQFYESHPEIAEKIWSAIEKLRITRFTSLAEKYGTL